LSKNSLEPQSGPGEESIYINKPVLSRAFLAFF
jgi:hypothetical protein